jgi:hypothetical protein
LRTERHRRFVGRLNERDLFRTALQEPDPAFCVLWIHGPGGVGKTTLLKEFVNLATEIQCRALYLDAKTFEPTPEAFSEALGRAMGEEGRDSPICRLAASTERRVLLIDTGEELNGLDPWLRETFLPQLPDCVLTVIAGRLAPGREWRTDPGWQSLLRVVSLRNLSPEESCVYLAARRVSAEHHQSVLEFTHGHPLALSLVADVYAQGHAGNFQAENEPDVIRVLLECFIAELPSQEHRQALEACALVHLTTEALLGELLEAADPRPLFEWLRGLSFIESGVAGLFPHDLAREVLTADLRWRNRDRYGELHERARRYYGTRLQQGSASQQQEVLFDYIYLHRDNPIVKPCFEWRRHARILAGGLRPEEDTGALLAIVERHEGAESAAIAAHWLQRQPQGALVFRDHQGEALGFLLTVSLEETSEAEREVDPAVRLAWRFLQSRAPLRTGEKATHFRFWMGAETYHAVSPVQSVILTSVVRYYLSTPGLAFSFFPVRRPELWSQMLAYTDLARITEAEFTVGGVTYGVFGHDWRTTPPAAWLALLAERETATTSQVAPAARSALLVLSPEDFTNAVRQALRDFARTDQLARNPLVRSRLVAERLAAEATDPTVLLQQQIQEAAAMLRDSPRDRKAYLALLHTYLQPAASQEAAAEMLDLPFSTYRRHLTAAVARVRDLLWQRELHGST